MTAYTMSIMFSRKGTGKTVDYHLNPIGSSKVGMLYIVGKLSSNAARIYTFRPRCFSLTAFIARKRHSLLLLFAITQASCERLTENVCTVCDVMEMCVSAA